MNEKMEALVKEASQGLDPLSGFIVSAVMIGEIATLDDVPRAARVVGVSSKMLRKQLGYMESRHIVLIRLSRLTGRSVVTLASPDLWLP